MINKKRLIKLTQRLIQINSENPPGDEYDIAAFIKKHLEALGLKPRTYEFKKRRSNIVAVLEGRSRVGSLLITPHLDTVPSGRNWRFPAFSGKIYQDKIYGLGATDCKGNLACSLEAINSLIEDGVSLDYKLVFAATADEETGSDLGLAPLLERGILKPRAAVVLDSDDFGIIVAQKGLIHLKVKVKGKRAHGAYPWLGINAIDRAIDMLNKLRAYKFAYRKNRYLKAPTINIGTIKGGDKVNIVADWCEFELDLRFLEPEKPQEILRGIKNIIQRYAKGFKIEIEGIQRPYSIDKGHPLVYYLARAMRELKVKPVIKGSEGATTISFFRDKDIPAVATGFGVSGCAHVANEFIKIENLYKGAQVLEEFLKRYQMKTRLSER